MDWLWHISILKAGPRDNCGKVPQAEPALPTAQGRPLVEEQPLGPTFHHIRIIAP